MNCPALGQFFPARETAIRYSCCTIISIPSRPFRLRLAFFTHGNARCMGFVDFAAVLGRGAPVVPQARTDRVRGCRGLGKPSAQTYMC